MRPIDLTWRGGEHAFLLNIDLLRALQQRCDAGPAWVLNRLRTGQWMVDDVIQPIRLGLEGGGTPKDVARRLVEEHVEGHPLAMSVITAQLILMSALFDPDEDDPVGEATAGVETTPIHSREGNGASADSTQPAHSSGSEPQSAV